MVLLLDNLVELVDLSLERLGSILGTIVSVDHLPSDELGLVDKVHWLSLVSAVEHFFVVDDAGGLLVHLRKVSL